MSTPQWGLSPDKMAQLFEDIGSIKETLEMQGRQLSDVHKTVYGNGEPALDVRVESLEKQMTKRHTLAAAIAGAVSLLYQVGVSIFTGHRTHGG